MFLLQELLPVVLFGLVGASCQRPSLQWGECDDIISDSSLPYQCASHDVPLDWTDPESGTIELQLIRVLATQQPSNGSIQFNFGGPGFESRNALLGEAERLLISTGGIYDLVAFDPRGTGNTIPFNCSNDPSDLTTLLSFYGPSVATELFEGRNWAFGGALAARCWHHHQEIGEMIGTAFGARDLMSVVDALDEDGKLRYWGFSYGTTLGATVSAMFPDRIDKVVLDGNQNIFEYYYGYGEIEQWTDTDKVFSQVWSTCIEAGPELCSLAARYNDSTVLESHVWGLVDELESNPIAVSTEEVSMVLDHTTLIGLFAGALSGIQVWPVLTAVVDMLLSGLADTEEFAVLLSSVLPVLSSDVIEANTLGGVRTIGIRGSDRFTRASSRDDLSATIAEQKGLSRLAGPAAASLALATSQWRFDAKERYEGSWEAIETSYPLLIVGNTFDGQTALACSHNTSTIFRDSVVLEVEVYGHTSLAGVSACSEATIAAYFVNGTLPDEGTVCPADILPYQIDF